MEYALVVMLFAIPILKDFGGKGKFDPRTRLGKFYLILMTLVMAINIYIVHERARIAELQRARVLADQARRDLHEALESKRWNLLELIVENLKAAIAVLDRLGGP